MAGFPTLAAVIVARLVVWVVVAGAVAGCAGAVRWDEPAPARGPAPGRTSATTPRPGGHLVQPGETLYGIARRYGVPVAELARWNGLNGESIIRPGQRLQLGPAGSLAAVPAGNTGPAPAFRWPAAGSVAAGFGTSSAALTGVLIGGSVGDGVRAAADGVVVYAGNSLPGYGELLIVKHDETWLSAYGHNSVLLVGEGARVRAGETIARLGLGPGRRPLLHFEIRQNGAPVDPLPLLPRR